MHIRHSAAALALTIAAAFYTSATSPLLAQSSTAAVYGRVLDPQNHPVARATIIIHNTDLSASRTITTGPSGDFRILALPSGAYTIEARANGLESKHPSRLTLTVGSTSQINLILSLPVVKQSATVHARPGLVEGNTTAPEVNKDDPSVGMTLAGLTVTYLPNRDRDFSQFAQLSPGTVEDPNSNGVILAGQRASSVLTQLDGISFNDPLHGGPRGLSDRAFFLPQTVIREFQILHSGVSADVGNTTSGLVNVVTKQGSGKIHGEFFYTLRPSALTSADAFGHSLSNTQNTFGGSTGGPLGTLLHKHAFYYAGFEQDFLHVTSVSSFAAQAPTSSLIIPAAIVSQQGQIVQHASPSAFFVRIDLIPTQRDTIALELGLNRVHTTNLPDALNTGASTRTTATAANAAELTGQSSTAIAQWMHLLSTHLVNQATLSWSEDHRNLTPNSSAPELVIHGFGTLGGNSFGPQLFTSQQLQFKDDISLTHGSTALNVGIAFANDPAYDQQEPNLNGRYDYTSLMAFLSGVPYRLQQTFLVSDAIQTLRYQGSIHELAFYANVRYTILPHVALTAGIRWAAQFNPQPQHPNVSIPLTTYIPSDLTQWQPRIGLAWNPTHKTTLRISSGLFAAPTPADIFHRVDTDNGQQTITADSDFDPQILYLGVIGGIPGTLPTLPHLTQPASLVVGISPNFRNSTSAQFAATLEYKFHPKFDVSAGYLHNATWHLQQRLDENLSAPIYDPTGNPTFSAVRPNPAIGRFLVNESSAHSSYNGLLVTAVSQISRRTQITANYTLSETRDDNSSAGPYSLDTALNPFNLHAEAAYSGQDVRSTFNLSAILNLPLGLKANPLFISRSGPPYTPIVGFDTQNDANDFNDRATINGLIAARNSIRQPDFNDFDLRLVKDFTLVGEGHHLDLFMDVFNLTGAQNRNFGPSSISFYGLSNSPIYTAGQPLFAPDSTRLGGAREIQFTARLVGF
jgi:hypothetical protein